MWLRLKEEHPEITYEETGRLITARVLAQLQKDIEDQMGIEQEESPEEKSE